MTALTCRLWWASPDDASPALLGLLDPGERERRERFRAAADRDRYLVAHALARLALARAAGCEPDRVSFTLRCRSCEHRRDRRPEPHGKPLPAGPAAGWEISISHSGDRVLLALTHGTPVGADVEQIAPGRDTDGLVDYCLRPRERGDLDRLPEGRRTEGFFGYWARKEALLKATGDGLSGGLGSVGVSGPFEPAAVVEWDSADAPVQVRLTDLDAGPGYRAALAALCAGPVNAQVCDTAELLGTRRTVG
ncbi:4'-phosphopantetheinyl transferase family protein [Streptomonospora salina]|uniref:4'-phosphopantetheinyl transferase n=1 Tax=Streptomonospora salina TaxID=104205 RepID=A0A841EDG3_9ACTN|nr:4'-phosphopantetheinyl transferase superfamily protein [Streptomonospora salina]MBB6001165.1 4'-phosphopantetheinyl transferase [Streptomonospora salina]